MNILNIAAYKFVVLAELPALRTRMLDECHSLKLKGTILLSPEGINLNLAGTVSQIEAFKAWLKTLEPFADMNFKESYSDFVPFQRMKVKLKKEIITLRRPEINPVDEIAPSISPAEFKRWLDENRDITILDTRNDYEVRFGTFQNAINPHIDDFCEFPKAAEKVSKDKPVVMFCTGGIRCEKAALVMQKAGFSQVFQLAGGILNYFAEIGGAHYDGDCFVFDERLALNSELKQSGVRQCVSCEGPVKTQSCEICN